MQKYVVSYILLIAMNHLNKLSTSEDIGCYYDILLVYGISNIIIIIINYWERSCSEVRTPLFE
jgi:hypothetical protein